MSNQEVKHTNIMLKNLLMIETVVVFIGAVALAQIDPLQEIFLYEFFSTFLPIFVSALLFHSLFFLMKGDISMREARLDRGLVGTLWLLHLPISISLGLLLSGVFLSP